MTIVPKSWVELLNPHLPPGQQNNDSIAFWLTWVHLYALAWGRMLCVRYAIPEDRSAWILGTRIWGPPTPSGYWVLKHALRTILRGILLRDQSPFIWPESKMHQILCGLAPSTNKPYHEISLIRTFNMQYISTFQMPDGITGADTRMLSEVILYDAFGEKNPDSDTTTLEKVPETLDNPLEVPIKLRLRREVVGATYSTIHGYLRLSPALREMWNRGPDARSALAARIAAELEDAEGPPDDEVITIVYEGEEYTALLHRYTPPGQRSWSRPNAFVLDARLPNCNVCATELDTSTHD